MALQSLATKLKVCSQLVSVYFGKYFATAEESYTYSSA